jgi:sugar lactone lactonase YvrE
MQVPATPAAGILASMHVIESGLGLVESPRWHRGRLYFADWLAGEIRVSHGHAGSEVVIRHASLPLCFDFLPGGDLILVSGPQRALLRAQPDGTLTTYADLSAFSKYGSNDIVIDGGGNAYVNNGNFDFAAGPPPGEKAPGHAVLVPAEGEPRLVAENLAFPNGMAVLPDNRTLVVAESYRTQLTAFVIEDDGSLGDRRVFADLGDDPPDGICADADGAIWYADVPHAHCVRVADGGAVLETVGLDRGAFACMLGGADGRTLFVVGAHWPGPHGLGDPTWTWDGAVWSTPVAAPRAGWPGDPAT